MVGREVGAPGEDEPRFRIRVCMRRYFGDERARCLLLVSARRRVRWLARRLRALFPLPPRTALLSRGHLLPRDEPLALLDADDLVEVVPRRGGQERNGVAHVGDEATVEVDAVDSRASVWNADEPRSDSQDDNANRDSEMADVPPSLAPEPDELRDSKIRALAELERYCGPTVSTTPRARRRRVRRRRRPAPQEPCDLADSSVGEDGAAGADAVRDAARGGGGARAPRLVRALSAGDAHDAPASRRASAAADDDDLSGPLV